jgi:hypothetical protein
MGRMTAPNMERDGEDESTIWIGMVTMTAPKG